MTDITVWQRHFHGKRGPVSTGLEMSTIYVEIVRLMEE